MSQRSIAREINRAAFVTRLVPGGLIVIAAILISARSPAIATESPAYDDALLAEWQQRYPRGILSNFREVILPRLDPEERRVLEHVGFRFPLRINGREPFAFAADSQNRTIFMSIQSLKFLDDANVAIAWLERNGYSQESAYNYLTMRGIGRHPTHRRHPCRPFASRPTRLTMQKSPRWPRKASVLP